MVEAMQVSDDPMTREIIGCAIEVHKALGPGLLESAYEACLCHELSARRVPYQRQLSIPVEYKGAALDSGFRIDLLVDDSVVVEIKAVDEVSRVHLAQLMTYMKLSGRSRGLILNFNTLLLRDGIFRRVL